MKNILNIFSIAIFLCGVSCTDDLKYQPGAVSPVQHLYSPQDKHYEELQSAASSNLEFSWETSYASDGQPVHYELAFYAHPDGEIIHRHDAGFSNHCSLSHKEINIIAKEAGIEVGQSGDFYWSVIACRGLYEAQPKATPRCISVKRLLGFDIIPSSLYISGEGSENGVGVSDAIIGRKTNDGEFVFYHRLTANKGFVFTDSQQAQHQIYTVENGILTDQSTIPATVGESGVYRISIDMNIRSIRFEYISRVMYNFAPRTEDNREMVYIGNGCWKLSDYKVNFKEEGWGLDERYNFHPFIDGVEYVWAGKKGNDSRPAETGGIEYKIETESLFTGDNYGPEKFKFHESFNKKTVDITLIMSGSAEYNTHTIEIK